MSAVHRSVQRPAAGDFGTRARLVLAVATVLATVLAAAMDPAQAAGATSSGAVPVAQAPELPAPLAEVHGSLDAYAGSGVALAWAVLRAGGPAGAQVVVRIQAEPRYRWIEVTGVDPFSHARRILLSPAALDAPFEFRLARDVFAEFPRTEWRFYASTSAPSSSRPALLIFYQGVPDTTPEFDDPARLADYLQARVTAVQKGAGK
jgi:hypothetical protein